MRTVAFLAILIPQISFAMCESVGTIIDMGVGEYNDTIHLDNGKKKVLQVKFTEVTVKIDKTDCSWFKKEHPPLPPPQAVGEKKSLIKSFGLCTDIDLKTGDIIKIKTDWSTLDTDCIFEAEILE